MHAGLAEVVTLSLEEARLTIHHYKTHRRQGHSRHWLGSIQSASVASSYGSPPLKTETTLSHAVELTTSERSSAITTPSNSTAICETDVPSPNITSSMITSSYPSSISSAFRCGICRRRFQTWSSLQLHSVFSHPPSTNSNTKRSYKKALLRKVLGCQTISSKKPDCPPPLDLQSELEVCSCFLRRN